MPQQAVFFDECAGAKHIQVLKVYDPAYARSCFDEMIEDALAFLQKALDLENKYEPAESPASLQWEDVEDEAREGGNVLSFFVVVEEIQGDSKAVYVSPDWPSAGQFARQRISGE